jgi:hypothetical protein
MDEVHVKLYLHIAEASYIPAMSELNKDILPNRAASQHWGYTKQKYHEFPPSSKEADLKRNLLAALEMVSLDKMRR